MFLLVPYGINALHQRHPIANWIIIGATVVVSVLALYTGTETEFAEPYESLVLHDWSLSGLFGYLLLHVDLFHLAGNMVFLWVFGNALCANMNNFLYFGIYVVLGVMAAVVHLLFDGMAAIGASGAINGIIGLALAVYPRDEVDIFYLVLIKPGTFQLPVWVLALIWLAFDILGALGSSGEVAYFAHIGGLGAGILIGLVLLKFEKIDLTIYDRETLLELIKGERVE